MSDWRATATEPTTQECGILEGPPPDQRRRLADATEPLEAEVQRVRFSPVRARSPWWWILPTGVGLAGLAWAAGIAWSPRAGGPVGASVPLPAEVPVLSVGPVVEPVRTIVPPEPVASVVAGRPRPAVAPTAASPDPEVDAESAPAPTVWFATLLERFEEGERTLALAAELGRFIAAVDNPALTEEAEVVALLVGAVVWSPEAALLALDGWLDRHPRHPNRVRVRLAWLEVADGRLDRCDLALPAYRELVAITSGATGAVLRDRMARCLAVTP